MNMKLVLVFVLGSIFAVSFMRGCETHARCASCFEGPCFNNASCNGGCRCYKAAGDQTGFCASTGYSPRVEK